MDTKIKSREEVHEEIQELQQKYIVRDSKLEAHERMSSLAKIGNWEYNDQDQKFSCSKELYKIFELKEEIELSLDNLLEYFKDESSGILSRAIKLAVEEGKSFVRDIEIRTASGGHKWVRIQGVVKDINSSSSNHIFGTIQDISEIRLIDHESHKSSLTLDRVEQITHIGHWSVNILDGSFYHSDEIKRIFGYEPSEYALSVEEAINSYHPDDRDEVVRLFNRAAETGEGYEFDLRLIQPGGNVRFVHSLGYTEMNEEGKVTMVYGVFQDITEMKLVEEELIKAKEKAEESDRLKSAFLANMSHEIRTPMNGILGFASLLKKPMLTGEKQQEYIEIIEKSSKRMLNIINDIVDISKIEAGLMNLEMRESNINEQIEYIYTFFKPEVEAKGMKFSLKNTLPDSEASIITDREKLYGILTNLVNNAIKYCIRGSVEIGYEKKGDFLEVFVRDTGVGIPKDRQGAIFERFIQADIYDKMAHQGAGLGLAISKAYVEMLKGKIWVESEEGVGSCFYFTLPYNVPKKENILDKKTVASARKEDESNAGISGLKILIAEDDKTSEMLMDAIIKDYSSLTLKARSGMEVIEVLHENPDIDLILMDIQMPDMNGYEATRQIRQVNNEVVIIAQTAFGLSGDREKALEAGCNDYIAKPINEGKIKALIEKYFGK